MPKPKDLYIATSLHDLNSKCGSGYEKNRSIKYQLELVNKAFLAAEKAFKDKDEERAYILYMRYAEAFSKIRKSKEFQQQAEHYNTLFGKSKLTTAIQNAETLSKSLKSRYEKQQEKQTKEAKKKDKEGEIDTKKSSDEKEMLVAETKVADEVPKVKINSQTLYKMLYKQKRKLLLMDIRSGKEYEDSHIIHDASINVPNEAIKPGTVTSKIQQGIPLVHVDTWKSRDSVELVVLMDWHSTAQRLEDMSDPLRSLKDSVYKWDLDAKLKHEPVVLEGGYSDWLESFPQFTSNPHVKPPSNKPKTGNVNSLIDFSYSSLKVNGFSASVEPQNGLQPSQNGTTDYHGNTGKVSETTNPTDMNHKNEAIPKIIKETVFSPEDHNSNLTSNIYPKIDLTSNQSQLPIHTTTQLPTKEVKTVPVLKQIPTFDRSSKPKPVTNGNKSGPDSFESVKENSGMLKPATNKIMNLPMPITIDRSTKPKLEIESKVIPIPATNIDQSYSKISKPHVSNTSSEVSVMEKKILQMKQENEEKESLLAEIEEKKKLAELHSQHKKMQENAATLQRRKEQAEKELAATMREVSKPTSPKTSSDMISQPLISNHKSSDNNNKELTSNANVVPKNNSPLSPQDTSKSAVPKPSFNPDNVLVSNTSITQHKDILKVEGNESQQHSQLETDSVKSTIIDAKNKTQEPVTNNAPNISHPNVRLPVNDKVVLLPKPRGSKPVPKDNTPATAKSNLVPNSVKPPIKKEIVVAPPSKPLSQVSKSPKAPVITTKPLNDTYPSENQSFGLKRSFSSPNIAKMVQNEQDNISHPEVQTKIVKSSNNISTDPIVPSRELKSKFLTNRSSSVSDISIQIRGVHGGQGRGLCGLRNLINSCYMNSVLQCMFNTTQLAEYILTNIYRNDINRANILGHGGKVAENFAALLRAVWSGLYKYLVPSEMKEIAGVCNPIFSGYSQEDSHEFLLLLLDGLHEDLNKITNFKYEEEPDNDHLDDVAAAQAAWKYHKKRNESIIVELFSGQFKATVRCLHCGKTSRKFDVFRFLSLSLPQHSTSLDQIMKDFSINEKMTGDDKWKCPSCKTLRDAVRTIQIWRLPPVLIIHFKRFVHTGRWREKIQTNVSYPIANLDLNPYTQGPAKRNAYHLFAVSHHHGGGLDSGHYTASCRSVVDNNWYKYDDTEVTRSSAPQGSSAFLLFYCCYGRQIPRQAPC